jgi:hypothetical protein
MNKNTLSHEYSDMSRNTWFRECHGLVYIWDKRGRFFYDPQTWCLIKRP